MSTSLRSAARRRARATDVAELAGVSRSAVSRAFSQTAYIAPETRARVLEAAAELNYSPDSLASSLAKGRSNIVVVVLNQVDAIRGPSFHSALIRSLQDSGRLPVVLTLSPTDDGAKSLKRHLTFPVEGLIVMSDSVSAEVALHAVPYVRPIMLNFERTHADVDSIVT
ncbi:MAG: LacI family DNA-binding transcriptional regulator, partial [Albidovulum sp.]|nr:LacI family DNA-binding transcriptional regulator [Albidovulum sp.]